MEGEANRANCPNLYQSFAKDVHTVSSANLLNVSGFSLPAIVFSYRLFAPSNSSHPTIFHAQRLSRVHQEHQARRDGNPRSKVNRRLGLYAVDQLLS